jgi:hypothetical protein
MKKLPKWLGGGSLGVEMTKHHRKKKNPSPNKYATKLTKVEVSD